MYRYYAIYYKGMADTMSLNLTLHSDIGTLHDEINDMKTETEQTRPPIGNNKK